MLTNITIEDAHEILSNEEIDIKLTEVSILESLDHILAEDIISDINIPPFDRSPLDGYAFKAEDTENAGTNSPVILDVIDNIQAGYISRKKIEKGQAVRIMTGAKIPQGANAIIRYEETEFTKENVTIFKSSKPNSNIVKMGEDISIGEVVLKKGTKIGAAEIGILASLGKSKVLVYTKPKIAILATGDELIDIEEDLVEGKIRNSNSYFLAAQIKKLGAEPIVLGICKDNIDSATQKLESSLEWADMVITTGGASVGDADIVKEVFKNIGADILFWKVQMKPGSPIIAAKFENKFLFGLSGNPAAAYITFELFVRPNILRLKGHTKNKLMTVKSTLESSFTKISKQNRYVRAFTYKKKGKYYTILPDKHSSGVLSSMIGKNSLFFVAANSKLYKPGDEIEVELLDYLEVGQ